MKFKLEIECDNAAFEDDPSYEVARILKEAATEKVEQGTLTGKLYDINGNLVGSFTYEDK
jgi:hypothetical protein